MPMVAIEDLIAKLRCCRREQFDEVDDVREVLRAAPVNPGSLKRYLNWDRQHYTRNLIDKTPLYELLAICWEPGQSSSVHNHHDQMCWMAAPIGRLLVQNYRVLREDMDSGVCDIEPSDAVEISPLSPTAVDPLKPVHKVYNPVEFGARAVSLHVYSKPFDRCRVYSQEQHKCGEVHLSYTSEFGVLSTNAAHGSHSISD
jgi:cysteine dioxygenase